MSRRRLWVKRALKTLVVVILVFFVVAVASTSWLDTMGAAPKGERLARIRRSPNYRDGAFQNPEATSSTPKGGMGRMLSRWIRGGEQRVPPGPMPIIPLTRADFEASRLRRVCAQRGSAHSSVLVEIDGARILLDPGLGSSRFTIIDHRSRGASFRRRSRSKIFRRSMR